MVTYPWLEEAGYRMERHGSVEMQCEQSRAARRLCAASRRGEVVWGCRKSALTRYVCLKSTIIVPPSFAHRQIRRARRSRDALSPIRMESEKSTEK